jgi:hypothetical protein
MRPLPAPLPLNTPEANKSLNEIWLELSVVVVSALQLVFDFGGSARVHEFLQQRYYDALSEMESDELDNPVAQKKWSARLLTISGGEMMPRSR